MQKACRYPRTARDKRSRARSNWGSLPWAYSTGKGTSSRGSYSHTFEALTIDEYIIDSQEQETPVA